MLRVDHQSGQQADWSHVGGQAHFVQFYEDELTLVPLLSRYIGTALVSGDAAVVISSETLRQRVSAHLRQQGYDVSVAQAQGRYVPLDGRTTLRHLMRGRSLDAARFHQLMGDTIGRASAGSRRTVVYGDMVAMLWADGDVDGAIRLEALWNERAAEQAFSLCCAYPMSGFSNARHAAEFLKICSQHSHVFSCEKRASTPRFSIVPEPAAHV